MLILAQKRRISSYIGLVPVSTLDLPCRPSAPFRFMFREGLYLQLISGFIFWCEAAENEEDNRYEKVEAAKECFRSILGVCCGVHRLTQPFSEGWQLFTGVPIFRDAFHRGEQPSLDEPLPIAGACPSKEMYDLQSIGSIAHASILEEECAATLDLIDDVSKYTLEANRPQCEYMLIWLADLRAHVSIAHFALFHRAV